MSEADGYVYIFPQCQSLLTNNKFISYSGFSGSHRPDAHSFHDKSQQKFFYSTLYDNILIVTLITHYTMHTYLCVCIYVGLQNELKEL